MSSDTSSSESDDDRTTTVHVEADEDDEEQQVDELDTLVQAAENAEKSQVSDQETTPTHSPRAQTPPKPPAAKAGIAKIVATHYNSLQEKGLDARSQSRIFYMRKFHNWIKSIIIDKYITKIKQTKKADIRVMDMCCGKGGDLNKWQSGGISHLICTDIAEVSLEQCRARYDQMYRQQRRDRNLFTAEFIHADCSRQILRERVSKPELLLDIVSCQFSFHYSFESLPQAETMIRNASECLTKGGFFLATIPNANELVARMRKAKGQPFGNDVYRVTFDCDLDEPPLFGGCYHFHLDGVVDCPEFLVHIPTLTDLAVKHGMYPAWKQGFPKFYLDAVKQGADLLRTMRTLEPYPPAEGQPGLVGTAAEDYSHAKEYLAAKTGAGEDRDKSGRQMRLGTLSKSEWEASCKWTSRRLDLWVCVFAHLGITFGSLIGYNQFEWKYEPIGEPNAIPPIRVM